MRGGGGWKIDELAQRAGIGVDTIRFYQREGLVQPGVRHGKSMEYGAAHLERLQRIAELREGHFTLTAIRRILDEGRFAMLERLFRGDTRSRTRQQLLDESGLPESMVEELEAIGFVANPAGRGAAEYDSADVRALQTVRELTELGTPLSVIPVIAKVYLAHMHELERDLISALSGDSDGGSGLSSDEVLRFRRQATILTEEYLARWDVIVDYLHHRAIQHLVSLARAERELRAGAAGARRGAPPANGAADGPPPRSSTGGSRQPSPA